MACEPHWTAYLSALLTPTVAVLGLFIAYRQWRTAQNKLKLDLFERRCAVHTAAVGLLGSIVASGKAKDEELFKFVSATRDAKWLFSLDVATYLNDEIYAKAIDLQCVSDELQDMPVSQERSSKVKERGELKKELYRQLKVLDEKMSPYLKLGH